MKKRLKSILLLGILGLELLYSNAEIQWNLQSNQPGIDISWHVADPYFRCTLSYRLPKQHPDSTQPESTLKKVIYRLVFGFQARPVGCK